MSAKVTLVVKMQSARIQLDLSHAFALMATLELRKAANVSFSFQLYLKLL